MAKNKSKMRGKMAPFTREQLGAIRTTLQNQLKLRDLALFNTGIDTMLRGGDLVSLRVRDVLEAGNIRETFTWQQEKTGMPVHCSLGDATRKSLRAWIATANLAPHDHLFPRSHSPGGVGISDAMLRLLIKGWVEAIGLNPEHYSGHSLRRTKAAIAYKSGISLEHIRRSLGHASISHTQEYLGITDADALEAMRGIEL